MKSPPGYPSSQQFLVAAYETLDFDSSKCFMTKEGGDKFASTLEEAREMIPEGAKQLPFKALDQFLELWEA